MKTQIKKIANLEEEYFALYENINCILTLNKRYMKKNIAKQKMKKQNMKN